MTEHLSLPRIVLVVATDTDAGTATAAAAVAAAVLARGTAVAVVDVAALPVDAGAPGVPQLVRAVGGAGDDADVVLLVAPRGLLAPLDARGATVGDVGRALRYKGTSTGAIVVTGGPDAVNLTALTAEALAHRDLSAVGLVVGAETPASDAELSRVAAAPVLGRLPSDAGGLAAEDLAAAAPGWLDGL